ncbi:MAG: hypothetical protein H5U40_15595, partial [Polyangiaceae bacterium]|nr:hypothetical protein [Polyangiaceae bacterium]
PVARATGEVEFHESEGRRLAVLPFPADGLVHVSLWIDAGSRDGTRPTLATLAAELAAERGGDAVRAWVSPDGIELATEGEVSELAELFGRLGRALSTREVDPERMTSRIAALERRSHRAAGDPLRVASELSVRALLGEAADGLFPLQSAEEDPPSSREVARFLADHFGAARTLTVVAGDVDRAAVRSTWARASRFWPDARLPRAERDGLDGRYATKLTIDRAPAFAATALVPSIEEALSARSIFDAHGSRATSFAYAVRGGALLTVVQEGARGAQQRETLLHLVRAIDAAAPNAQAPSWATSPREAAHQVGLRWSTRSEVDSRRNALGVGAVVDGGRGD